VLLLSHAGSIFVNEFLALVIPKFDKRREMCYIYVNATIWVVLVALLASRTASKERTPTVMILTATAPNCRSLGPLSLMLGNRDTQSIDSDACPLPDPIEYQCAKLL
jgi:hypothetical protein